MERKLPRRQLILLVPRQNHYWTSVKKITDNLIKAYKKAFGAKLKVIKLSPEPTSCQIKAITKEIITGGISKICFVGMKPHPLHLLPDLKSKLASVPTLFFHLYGDFTSCPNLWLMSQPYIGRAIFFTASEKQRNLVANFFKKGAPIVCPFPCDEEEYFYSKKDRIIQRKRWGFTDQDTVLLYSGRLSPQKNVLNLIRSFSEAVKKSGRENLYLILAGEIDNYNPFLRAPKKTVEQELIDLMKKVPEKIKSKIIFCSKLNSKELFGLYNAIDIFISLSTFHDEDFGMAPLEAFFCGAKAVLTNWGGYASFRSSYVRYIPLEIQNPYLLDEAKLAMYLAGVEKSDDRERVKISWYYRKRFSVRAVSKKLSDMIKNEPGEFKGFNRKLEEYGQFYKRALNNKPLYPRGPSRTGMYYEIYSNYLK